MQSGHKHPLTHRLVLYALEAGGMLILRSNSESGLYYTFWENYRVFTL